MGDKCWLCGEELKYVMVDEKDCGVYATILGGVCDKTMTYYRKPLIFHQQCMKKLLREHKWSDRD